MRVPGITNIVRSIGIRRVVAAVGVAAMLAGCGTPDITRPRIERDIAPNFANQYREQQRLLGRSRPSVASIDSSATCRKGGPTVPDEGPGKDWVCAITWTDVGGAARTSRYEVNIRTESCYTATDPALTAHDQFITTPAKEQVDNPLYQFDGCFNALA